MEILAVKRFNDVKLTFVSETDLNYIYKINQRFCIISAGVLSEYSYPSNGIEMNFICKEDSTEDFRREVVHMMQEAVVDNESVNIIIVVMRAENGNPVERLRKVEFSKRHEHLE